MTDGEFQDKTFIEKAFYIEPPHLQNTATEQEKKEAWSKWITENAKGRANHKRKWTKAQKPRDLPDFNRANTMVKIQGVWKQQQSMTGLVGDVGLRTLETVLIEMATQDRHHQARGVGAGRSGNKHRNTRLKKRELKRQLVLNKKKNHTDI